MIWVFLIVCFFKTIEGYNLLCLFPHVGKSHLVAFQPLLEELSIRGHTLTVVSFFPKGGWTEEVSLEGLKIVESGNGLEFSSLEQLNPFMDFVDISGLGLETCRSVLPSQQIQSLIKTNASFDLALVELFTTDCFLSIVNRLRIPFIGLSSSSIFPTTESRLGNPNNPAYVPNMFLPYTDAMSFWERLRNTFVTIFMHLYRYYLEIETEDLVRRHVGDGGKSLEEMARETRLILSNRHFTLNRPRPLHPSIIEVGGLHIRAPKTIPNDIEAFISEWKGGVIYFSMGSILQAKSLPEGVKEAFLEAFSRLPFGVIWKYEGDDLHSLESNNVYLSKWLPQRDILEDKRVKLFISHGGYLSISEGVHCGVPILGIPMYGDQWSNIASLEATGAALTLHFQSINVETILDKINSIMYNSSYAERAQELSRMFKDRPMTALETAVYWTEYAASKKLWWPLDSPSSRLPWYQIYLLDVAAFTLTIPIIIALLLVCLSRLASTVSVKEKSS